MDHAFWGTFSGAVTKLRKKVDRCCFYFY